MVAITRIAQCLVANVHDRDGERRVLPFCCWKCLVESIPLGDGKRWARPFCCRITHKWNKHFYIYWLFLQVVQWYTSIILYTLIIYYWFISEMITMHWYDNFKHMWCGKFKHFRYNSTSWGVGIILWLFEFLQFGSIQGKNARANGSTLQFFRDLPATNLILPATFMIVVWFSLSLRGTTRSA